LTRSTSSSTGWLVAGVSFILRWHSVEYLRDHRNRYRKDQWAQNGQEPLLQKSLAAREQKTEDGWAEEQAEGDPPVEQPSRQGVWRWRSWRGVGRYDFGRQARNPGLVVCGWWCYSPFK